MHMPSDIVEESKRALAHAAHKYYHQRPSAVNSVPDFRAEMAAFAEMNTAVLRDYVWLWMCPDNGNCGWTKWWEAERSSDA
jgi:hypothetical protein